MPATATASSPASANALQQHVERTQWQTAIVRTVIDEIERCEYSLELAEHLNLQLIEELKRLARRLIDVADALERSPSDQAFVPEPSGVRRRSSI